MHSVSLSASQTLVLGHLTHLEHEKRGIPAAS